ncbi:HSP20-like chaperone [Amylocarpus encephaloides]|uniref:HSP20-like chaperone n=1 Tax=Amylocarpus encephaloides TaxID=45428 RepID=A0A9P7YN80_9HELO|nr:HSP20-like chaperone [Amylocarpus encephaloides]
MFDPKFDVKETTHGYELHGEFSGVDQRDIEIEFTDPTTLAITGLKERLYETAERRVHAVIEEDQGRVSPKESAKVESPALAEDGQATTESAASKTAAPKKTPFERALETEREIANGGKYWVAERDVGAFCRSFSFPVKVEQEEVKASMRNGMLSIWVPKARKPGRTRVMISSAARPRNSRRASGEVDGS